ncbi:MAG: arginine repressor [Clostridia bacterium]|nr:arginine repressor [Clostridia bacterium]
MDRSERQLRIIELVKSQIIETQEDMVTKLRGMGFRVTQATISRDIKELGLIKVSHEGRYRYAMPTAPSDMQVSQAMLSLYREVVEKVIVSLNLVVIRTHPGNAVSVASMLDSIRLPNVVGSVSGDDTIILVAESVSAAPEVAEQLRSML